jgi:hypothetical protein
MIGILKLLQRPTLQQEVLNKLKKPTFLTDQLLRLNSIFEMNLLLK